MSKFYICIICSADSRPECVDDEGFETIEEAKAAVAGFNLAKKQTDLHADSSQGEFDQLEEFHAEVCTKVNDEMFQRVEAK